jgi:hypothetical protein
MSRSDDGDEDFNFVMAGLDPAIHVLLLGAKDVDTRDKPGYDAAGYGEVLT